MSTLRQCMFCAEAKGRTCLACEGTGQINVEKQLQRLDIISNDQRQYKAMVIGLRRSREAILDELNKAGYAPAVVGRTIADHIVEELNEPVVHPFVHEVDSRHQLEWRMDCYTHTAELRCERCDFVCTTTSNVWVDFLGGDVLFTPCAGKNDG